MAGKTAVETKKKVAAAIPQGAQQSQAADPLPNLTEESSKAVSKQSQLDGSPHECDHS
jgi:hypothetical protein